MDEEPWSGRGDSNPRHLPWQGSALPLSYSRSSTKLRRYAGAEGRNRTGDTSIFSAVLYQLSYLGAGVYYRLLRLGLSREFE